MEYTARRGTTALGIIGATLGGLAVAGGNLLGNGHTLNTGNGCAGNDGCGCSEDRLVNRYEAAQAARISELEMEVRLRDANTYTDQKLLGAYQFVDGQLRQARISLCERRVLNQRTQDSFALALVGLAAVKAELSGEIRMEAEWRFCGGNATVICINATFCFKMVVAVTVGTAAIATAAQSLYNPIPRCRYCNWNG